MMRLAEEQQRLMQQALQQNLLAMASQFNPMSLKLNNGHGVSFLPMRFHIITDLFRINWWKDYKLLSLCCRKEKRFVYEHLNQWTSKHQCICGGQWYSLLRSVMKRCLAKLFMHRKLFFFFWEGGYVLIPNIHIMVTPLQAVT